MQFITGHFKGNYKGKEVDPLKLRTLTSLHFLDVESGAVIDNCKWVDDFRTIDFKEQLISITSIQYADLYFNEQLYPNQKPFRESLHDCILLNPIVHSVFRKENYTYGVIEGEIFAVIGGQEKIKPVSKIIDTVNFITPVVRYNSLPLKVADNKPDWRPEKISTWNWGNCFGTLLWLLFLLGLFWWLLHHRGCSPLPNKRNNSFPTSDSILTKKDNDSIFLKNKNVVFSVYDWAIEDHDTINVYINDNLVKEKIELNKKVQSWIEDKLPYGDNKLRIESVDNGTVGPASPTIEMNDGTNTIFFKASVYKGQPQTYHLIVQ